VLSGADSGPVSLGGRGRAHAPRWDAAVRQKLNSLRWGRRLIIMGRKERAGFGVSRAPLVAAVARVPLACAGRADLKMQPFDPNQQPDPAFLHRQQVLKQEHSRQDRHRTRLSTAVGWSAGVAVLSWMIVIATHVEWVRQHDGPSIHPIPYFIPLAVSVLAAAFLFLLRQRRASPVQVRYSAEGVDAAARHRAAGHAAGPYAEPDATPLTARRNVHGGSTAVHPQRGAETSPAAGGLGLVVISGSGRDRQIPIPAGGMVLGRDDQLGLPFSTDLLVSRRHVSVHRCGDGCVEVADLGSANGTFVNGTKIHARTRVEAGDVLCIGKIELKLGPALPAGTSLDETLGFKPASTTTGVPGGMPGEAAPSSAAQYHFDRQTGEIISNVAGNQYNSGDQYNSYVQERENFLRAIAATKTKARWLIWAGFLAFVVGFCLFAAGVLGFMKQAGNAAQTGGSVTSPFGPDIGGVPSGLFGWALAALGLLLLVVGIVLHIVATSRSRRVDRELPAPAPWLGTGP
jgi:FHA domain